MHEQIEMCIAASATGIAETPNKVISRQPQERGDGWAGSADFADDTISMIWEWHHGIECRMVAGSLPIFSRQYLA
ncbi:hypothetical protein RirG_011210 [Rhizophagus irregularis DAOM 197198w]|uniref:Uncharacterized protein n=1 Tax=Rhizophagus irregularis (strain DAOM 197198w) TaxID=1432141 RepID=A0A015NHG3_RHIIW|nr:hypothetical protein RirG_011210 [Rhizophagus irregularis DAOM 197198w]